MIFSRGGGFIKKQYREGTLPTKGAWEGQFADLRRGLMKKKRGWGF